MEYPEFQTEIFGRMESAQGDVAYTPVSAGARVLSSTDERSESEEEEEDDSIFSNANTSDRRLDTSWCLCDKCTIMPTEVESICCKEPAFLSKMVEGIM